MIYNQTQCGWMAGTIHVHLASCTVLCTVLAWQIGYNSHLKQYMQRTCHHQVQKHTNSVGDIIPCCKASKHVASELCITASAHLSICSCVRSSEDSVSPLEVVALPLTDSVLELHTGAEPGAGGSKGVVTASAGAAATATTGTLLVCAGEASGVLALSSGCSSSAGLVSAASACCSRIAAAYSAYSSVRRCSVRA